MIERTLSENLAALGRAGARSLEALLADVSADGAVETSAGMVAGVSLRGRAGMVRMHGRRDPVAEAGRTLPEELAVPLVVLLGAGAGYVIDALEGRGFAGRVLLLEPSAASLKTMLGRRSLGSLVETGRLRLLAGPDYGGWMDLAKWVGAIEGTPPLVVHPVLARERPDEVRRAADLIKRLLFNAEANEAARKAFAGPYLLNTLTNLRHLVESRDVAELFGRFAGVPAFVLAAGPSLNRNLDDLRPHRDGALVVAVDTALRPCLAQGIEPDLVVGVDPGEANLRHLAIGAAPPRTHLVAEPSLAPGSFDAFAGRVFTFRVARHHPWPWLQENGIDRAQLLAWGSVLTTALDLTVRLGCSPVVLLGADFAYTNGQPYCRGTAFEDDWARQVEAGEPIEQVWRKWMRQPTVVERGIDGQDVETAAHLQAFRDWVVEFCGKHAGVEFGNGTGAGVLVMAPRASGADRTEFLREGGSTAPRGLAEVLTNGTRELAEPRFDQARALSSAPWRRWARIAGMEPFDAVAREGALPQDRSGGPPADRGRSLFEVLQRFARGEDGADRGEPEEPFVERAEATDEPGQAFSTNHYLQFVARRLEHVASLGLPLAGRHVLEVGAGAGHLTGFFLDRGCRVTTSDARLDNTKVLRRRFLGCRRVEVRQLDLDPPPAWIPTYDVVVCYGVLYHLSDPEPALDVLSAAARGLLLVETIVADAVDDRRWVSGAPAGGTVNDSITGRTCRPGRRWLFERLRLRFPFVYLPTTQPNHCQFPLDWEVERSGVRRAVFIASREPLVSPLLAAEFLLQQRRQP